MLEKEIRVGATLRDITPETSLITNLQNIKYGLLADYSDEEICRTVLQRLAFTNSLSIKSFKLLKILPSLIEHHLAKQT